MKTRDIHFKADEALYDHVREMAHQERVSIGEYIRSLIEKERGSRKEKEDNGSV